ncbi:unnamed protein product [Brassicogethes aeneus]|uniref:Phenoloxidase-activating factor 2 n=1 Tax=Brassicogethes aeneus TaxID=1431903 RepID=A0A9P0FJQ4_BRAAE|nr:unnamed protein product [Brassicogethes aeneus]
MSPGKPLIVLAAIATVVFAQGKDLNSLIKELKAEQREGSVDNQADVDKKIQDIFGTSDPNPPSQPMISTTAPPNLQPNSGGIPGTGSCTCVPYYLCNNGSINTNGEGVIDIRINEESACPSYIEICCDKEQQTREPLLPEPKPNKKRGCGYRNEEGVGFRITGDKDNEAQFGEFPWMVAVLKEEVVEGSNQNLNVYQCGGALIHPQVVVTAAHCIAQKKNQFKIRAGEWDTQTTQELYPHQDRDVASSVIHPQYYAGALYNDIALLFLRQPVTPAENVDVICLPPKGTVSDHSRCFASGWGKDVFGKQGKYQVILKKIDLPVVPRQTCQDKLRTTRLGKYFELHPSFICAGGEPGKDTCKGDGGSPLVCPIPGQTDRYYQAGIVAWGIGCGENNTPGVYANVASFRDWIDEQMRKANVDFDSYSY